MPRHSRLLSKTKYREPLKGDTSTDFMPFSRCWAEPVPMKQLTCMEIRREPLNIGYSDSLLRESPVCWRGTIPDAHLVSLLPNRRDCAKISVVLPENWDTTKTCGMDCCCLITLPKIILYPSVSGNVRGSSTSLALASRGLAEKLSKPTFAGRKTLKKLLPINARPDRSTLVRGRSPFSTPQYSDKNVVTKRRTTSRTLTFLPSQSRLLWSTQFENRSSPYPGSTYFQCSNLWRLYSLSSPINSRQNISYSGQRPMAQVARSQALLRGEQEPYSIALSASIFSRTQSHRASLESYSPNGNPQPLFFLVRRASLSFDFSIRSLESTKQCF